MSDNQTKLNGISDAIFVGGKSMLRGESLQKMIDQAPVRALQAPVITGWKDAKGKEYSTSIAQQVAYNAQALQRIEAQLAVVVAALKEAK